MELQARVGREHHGRVCMHIVSPGHGMDCIKLVAPHYYVTGNEISISNLSGFFVCDFGGSYYTRVCTPS